MRYYETDDNRKGKRAGLIAAGAYFAVLLLLFLTVDFRMESKTFSEGIIIDFGFSEEGAESREVTASQKEEPDPVPTQPAKEIMTQETEEAPPVEKQAIQDPDPVTDPVEVEEPKVNPRALFPGVSANPDTKSQGDSGQQSNRGHEAGQESTRDAAGKGSEGAEVNLPDRQVIGRLPLPVYTENVEGRIIVDIVVDSRGNVTQATVRSQGTTILNETLRREAVEAARKSRFSAAVPTEQTGSITYVFKLK